MTIKDWLRVCAIVIVLTVLATRIEPITLAQGQACGATGTVRDLTTGQIIAGATVFVGGEQVTTDAAGRYRLFLSPGVYEIRARANGYIGMSQTRQRIEAGTFTEVNFDMVLQSPSAEQQARIDEILRQQSQQAGQDELAVARERGFALSTATRVPETIPVLMPDGTVVVMPMDEYLKGVVPYEIGPYAPMEALRAQAVAARGYATTRVEGGVPICTTTLCQVWKPTHYETTDAAVDSTHGVAAFYGSNIIRAFFFGHCDGHTRNVETVWGGSPIPYLRSVQCPCGFTHLWGHGVGMCQEGAKVLADQGWSYQDILRHYYTGITIPPIYAPTLSEGSVTPSIGSPETLFTFAVTYRDADGDPPARATVYINGVSYAMTRESGTFTGGARYVYRTTLPAGEHNYSFGFEDGYSGPVNLPAAGTFSGPSVRDQGLNDPTPVPTPTPGPNQTVARQWSQTSLADWEGGDFMNVALTDHEDGALVLTPGSLQGSYTSVAHRTDITFVAIGSTWLGDFPAETTFALELRTSTDSISWSPWYPVAIDDAEGAGGGPLYGNLIFTAGQWVQYRVRLTRATPQTTSPRLRSLTLVCIDSTRGPTSAEAEAQMRARIAASELPIISRAEWGADESLMTWPPEYRIPRVFIVHHTVTANNDPNPAATVRAIYYYHAVTRGWGDIGYNYLIDQDGRIYEGRYGGEGVVGAHAKQYNWGSIGVAMMGNYDEVAVPSLLKSALAELIAWKGNHHFINPVGSTYFIDRTFPNVMGHRDCAATTCPGSYGYAILPEVRQRALSRMLELPPNTRVSAPVEGASLSGVVQVEADGSPAVTAIDFYIDGEYQANDNTAPFTWKWNTVRHSEGNHTLAVLARTNAGLTAWHEINVRVDHTPPSGSITTPMFSNTSFVTLNLAASGATQMMFSNGWHWEGEELSHQPGAGQEIADPAARNGRAWQGRAGVDASGWWYGPYYKTLPTGASYRTYYRLKVGNNASPQTVAIIDVTDDFGQHTYAEQALTGDDFSAPLTYVEPYLDFWYSRVDDYGLETRTFFCGVTDLYLDDVWIFRAPVGYATTWQWRLGDADGPYTVSARFADEAGNLSSIYSATVTLDQTAPEWVSWDGTSAFVRDVTSGLRVASAEYSLSADGGSTWGDWARAIITATEGTTATVPVSGNYGTANRVRFRIEDRAGNTSESPPYMLGSGPTPTATATPLSSPTPTPTTPRTVTPTPTVSPTPTPLVGDVWGWVTLQGRMNHAGTHIEVGDLATDVSDPSGLFVLPGVPVGYYTVRATMPGYLAAWRDLEVSAGQLVRLPDVMLLGGDANGDCRVNIFDLVIVASDPAWTGDSCEPRDPHADINGDGCVNIFDLVLVGLNYDCVCPSPWGTGGEATSAAPEIVHISLRPERTHVRPGESVTVDVVAEDAVALYGAEMTLRTDSTSLQMVSIEPGRKDAFVAYQMCGADRASLVYTLLAPATPMDGEVVLARVTLEALTEGNVSVAVERIVLVDRSAQKVPVQEDLWIGPPSPHVVYLPILLQDAGEGSNPILYIRR
ncbi:MAG: SpoIID/LytB domain-containing protein [Chloroflexi bacterium]|nr:SpoIID/LytB domain-containing protein [Chloroflexota bacterium]